MVYLDTSLLAAYYCPEPLSAKAQRVLMTAGPAAISRLVELELHSALAMKVRRKELGAAAARRVLSLFGLHVSDGFFRLVPIGEPEYALARGWIGSFSSPLRTLDALHLAAAFAHDLTLLTADKLLAHSAGRFGVRCKLIA